MRMRLLAAASVGLVLGACAGLRWAGSPAPVGRTAEDDLHPPPNYLPEIEDKAPRAASRAPSSPLVIPEASAERRKAALFYSDLGYEGVDVSRYPAQIQYDYSVYQRVCSRCHSLARSINAPYVTRGWWEFYMMGMRARARWQGEALSKKDTAAVLDFLEYDSYARKAAKPAEFERVKAELKRRFERALDERMEELQKTAPKLSR